MLPTYTPEQILALAPDAGAAQSGRGLATPRSWPTLGRSDVALWGECKGSGKDPYRVQVDLREPAFRCSCPSRKFPCKHAIGLLLLYATQPAALAEGEAPAWVAEWLSKRGEASAKKAERQAAPPAPPTAARKAAQARTAAARDAKVAAGVEELRRWLRDQVRQGLADAQGRSPAAWSAVAARMVDAQAPGLARLVRELPGAAASGEGWQGRMLAALSRIHMLCEGYLRLAELPPELQAEVRTQVGWAQDQEALRSGPTVRDRWLALGQRVEEEQDLRAQRTWLWGEASGRPALLLSFAPAGQPLDRSVVVGMAFEADLAFYEGAAPLRALVAARHGEPAPVGGLPGHATVGEAAGRYADSLARCPWLERYPLALTSVTPALEGGRWLLRDGEGGALPLAARGAQGWRLLAMSGGRPLGVFGEWDGAALAPLSAWSEGGLRLLGDGDREAGR